MAIIKMYLLAFFLIARAISILAESKFLGCYRNNTAGQLFHAGDRLSTVDCRQKCKDEHYRYAMFGMQFNCICANYLGSEFRKDNYCRGICQNCTEIKLLVDVYSTGQEVPGPPLNLTVSNITEISAYISWKPAVGANITGYEISLAILKSFSGYDTVTYSLNFPSDTSTTELNLMPGTIYEVAAQATSDDGKGVPAKVEVETLIGTPDVVPSIPTVLKRDSRTMTVHLRPVINNNGPITAYQIVVIKVDSGQIMQIENLKDYSEAMNEGLGYYIAAELPPKDLPWNFTVGDGHVYNGYVNTPLEPFGHYQVLLGIVSSHKNVTKVLFSNITVLNGDVDITPLPDDTNSGLIIGLSIAIGVMSCVLLAGIIGFYFLTKRVSNRRRRLTDNQELTVQGPMIEIENSGYIPEDEVVPSNHLQNLQQQVWCIPQAAIKIDPMNTLGAGKYGRVNSGTIRKENNSLNVAIYTIFDKKLGHDNKRAMLKDLDILIRTGKHENVIALVGTCENPDTLFVALEYNSMNLKDLLLGSRDALPGRFSNMHEAKALQIATNIAKGMAHLESLKILHKQLCARNILMTSVLVPKISGYGLSQYNGRNMVPDYTRWTAAEIFCAPLCSPKVDIWSFAVLLWEICVLGGTPYASVPNNEIPDKVMRGLRLTQARYISDELYQLMLNCWQLDLDERPTFKSLVASLQNIFDDKAVVHLNFSLYSEFQYEQFYPDMELAVRTVY